MVESLGLEASPGWGTSLERARDDLVRRGRRDGRLTHLETIEARVARPVDWPAWLPPDLRRAWVAAGITRPWTHQVEAAELARAGRHVVLATGTASGKSLGYLMPGLTAVLEGRGPRGRRGASVLYISPTKALAHDQRASVAAVAAGLGSVVRVATHDGDSTTEEREWTRAHGEWVLTNPDMLHRSLLPGHRRWAELLGSVRFVVVDECHRYRGVFGAHVAHVLRRLRRVCASYGAHPTFVLASATVAEPEVAAGRLTGLDVTAVTDDGSPHGELSLALWEPPVVSGAGVEAATTAGRADRSRPAQVDVETAGDEGRAAAEVRGAPGGERRSSGAETADLLADLVANGVRTLAFVRSRRGAETVALTTRRLLAEAAPELAARVAAYRGGYLPEERRALETALRSGRLLGLAATNALELGIDVSGLDAVVVAGFPGTRAALWQQLGRAGRHGGDALGVFVARDDPLDTYLVHHPDALIGAPVEACVLDPTNPYVLGPHLCAAADELPLVSDELTGTGIFGAGAAAAVEALTGAGLLRRRPTGWYWTDRRRACDLADLRGTGGPPVSLVESGTGRVLGTVDCGSSHGTVHEGAVYLHQGDTWVVGSLDLDEHVATMAREDPGWTTSARELTDIEIVSELTRETWGEATLSFGSVRVVQQVVSYLRRDLRGGHLLGEEPLDLPERTLDTSAVWWTLPAHLLDGVLAPADLPGAAHAAEHASIGLLPLFATCDRWDIGGVSTALHPDTGRLTVFVHDGHPGGAGFAERGFHTAGEWLRATRHAIAECRCESGCPSCVQSPKCGNQNHPLDKAGAVRLLDVLLGQREGVSPNARPSRASSRACDGKARE